MGSKKEPIVTAWGTFESKEELNAFIQRAKQSQRTKRPKVFRF
jgi:hypothetical protein